MFRVRFSGHGGRGVRAGLATAVAAALLLSAAIFSGIPAQALEEDPDQTSTAQEALQPSLSLAPESPLLALGEDQYRFDALLNNPGDAQLGAGTLTLWADSVRAQSLADLGATREDREAIIVTRVEVDQTQPASEQQFSIEIERGELPIELLSEPGVYTLWAEFTPILSRQARESAIAAEPPEEPEPEPEEAGESVEPQPEPEPPLTLTAATRIVWGEVSAPPVPLTLVVPLLLPGSVQPMPDREQLQAVSGPLLEVLSAAERRRATVAVDPRIIAATRALGTLAPDAALELVERIETSPSPVFLLQFADADPAAQAALGFETLLQPIGLAHLTATGDFDWPEPEANEAEASETEASDGAAGDASGDDAETANDDAATELPEPSETDETSPEDPGTPALPETPAEPTLDELLSLETARTAAWPASGEVDLDTLAMLRRSGISGLVLDASNVSAPTSTRVMIGDFEALVADAALGHSAREALVGTHEVLQRGGVAELGARLALGAELGSGGFVLAIDRGAVADSPESLLAFFETLDSLSWVLPVAEDQLSLGTATLRGGEPSEQRLEMLSGAIMRSAQINELAPLLTQPEFLPEYQRLRLLASFATSHAETGVDLDEVDAAIKTRDDELLAGVHPVTTDTQLVGTSSRVPVSLVNSLPFEASVHLNASPISAAISVPERSFDVVVEPGARSDVLVQVDSRVSSGISGLALRVEDRAQQQVYSEGTLQLTLRTSIESILLVILGAGAAALLGFGIWRSLKRRRAEEKP